MMLPARFRFWRALPALLLLGACQSSGTKAGTDAETAAARAAPDSVAFTVRHPVWARTAIIYQVNVRQYTPQGTFRTAEADLLRLQRMGVGILWLMPINPIGISHRKGTLGSAYSVRE